jgi:hypothetical protein
MGSLVVIATEMWVGENGKDGSVCLELRIPGSLNIEFSNDLFGSKTLRPNDR